MLGEPFDAGRALQMGLVNRVLPAPEVFGHAQAQAKKLVEKPASALAETRRLLKADVQQAVVQRIADESVVFGKMVVGGAAKEAIAAFSEKRKPDFSRF